MSIENEIIKLTQSTEGLLTTINTQKTVLDSAVSNATAQVTDAQSKVALTEVEKTLAETARNEAETHKNLAYTYSQSAASAVAYQDLTTIAESKVETAVDVFVYDTRKDSDGGAWRKRTQSTSWYNETLNTTTRGSRKEFPAVAVIVAEATKVTIYDGDDLSLPMWMVFNSSAGGFLYSAAKAVTMINGMLASGTAASFSQADFIKDGYFFRNSNGVKWNTENILNRNKTGGPYNTGVIPAIVSASVNDVAMTVLPNAPIDPDTGLPIPTIAVATEGGVSVIKDDGTVVDSNTTSPKVSLGFSKDYRLSSCNRSSANFLLHGYVGDLNFGFPSKIVFPTSGYPKLFPYLQDGGFEYANNIISSGSDAGVFLIDEDGNYLYDNLVLETKGLSALITSTYNTGWMNGDIKLATLSDTDDTDLVGSELVTNGTFDSDVSGWVAYGNATIQESNNELLATMQTNSSGARVTIPTEVGKTYYVVVDITSISSGNAQFKWNLDNSQRQFTTTPKTISGYYIATSTTTSVEIGANSDMTFPSTITIDNVSVRLAESDRSVNNNGLQVFGTVQKNPVATGADLVGYSGFSASNYLEQPYNPDLDFGTGDFCVMGWVKRATMITSERIISRDDGSASSRLCVDLAAGYYRGFVTDSNGTAKLLTSSYAAAGNWDYVCFMRSSGFMYIYVNGISKATPLANTDDISNDDAPLYVGVSGIGGGPFRGSLALWRVSKTAPTAEQIAKIYRDEKPLFQENAQATLHGTSDAVTALAYDDSTELLHVGTSAGRSVFQGLERVDNTTDAVGIAISASNGLVVEE